VLFRSVNFLTPLPLSILEEVLLYSQDS